MNDFSENARASYINEGLTLKEISDKYNVQCFDMVSVVSTLTDEDIKAHKEILRERLIAMIKSGTPIDMISKNTGVSFSIVRGIAKEIA